MSNQEQEILARDSQAEEFEEWYLKKGFFYDWVEKKTIRNSLNLQSGDIVLDAGCGTGRLARAIAKQCKKVYGLDFSAKSIEVLNRRAIDEGIHNIETYICDFIKYIPIKEKVDKIISVQAIQHIPAAGEKIKALKNLYDQLKPGGICV